MSSPWLFSGILFYKNEDKQNVFQDDCCNQNDENNENTSEISDLSDLSQESWQPNQGNLNGRSIMAVIRNLQKIFTSHILMKLFLLSMHFDFYKSSSWT